MLLLGYTKPAKPSGDTFHKTVAGYSVTGIEFKGYRPGVILAKDRFYQTESDSSMVKRSGAQIVCNGPFFNNHGDLTTYISAVVDGKYEVHAYAADDQPTAIGEGRLVVQPFSATAAVGTVPDGTVQQVAELPTSSGSTVQVVMVYADGEWQMQVID